jgi:hypothetical protein
MGISKVGSLDRLIAVLSGKERASRFQRLRQIDAELQFPMLTVAQSMSLESERLSLENTLAFDNVRREAI